MSQLPSRRAAQRGFLLPAIVFALVILAGIIAAMALLSAQSNQALGLEVQGARALAAANAGGDWGAWKVRDPLGAMNSNTDLPACFTSPATLAALPAPLSDYTVVVTCSRSPTTGVIDEGGLILAFYLITATATIGVAGTPDYVERSVELRVESCKNPLAAGPQYAC